MAVSFPVAGYLRRRIYPSTCHKWLTICSQKLYWVYITTVEINTRISLLLRTDCIDKYNTWLPYDRSYDTSLPYDLEKYHPSIALTTSLSPILWSKYSTQLLQVFDTNIPVCIRHEKYSNYSTQIIQQVFDTNKYKLE